MRSKHPSKYSRVQKAEKAFRFHNGSIMQGDEKVDIDKEDEQVMLFEVLRKKRPEILDSKKRMF